MELGTSDGGGWGQLKGVKRLDETKVLRGSETKDAKQP